MRLDDTDNNALTLALARFHAAVMDLASTYHAVPAAEIEAEAKDAGLLRYVRFAEPNPLGAGNYVDTDLSRQALALVEASK